MRIETFEEINAWKEAKKLTMLVYQLTKNGDFVKDFPLRDQIRRSAISVMANIAEGFGRNSTKEFIRFLKIAQASACEVQSHLHIAVELEYIDKSQFHRCYQMCISSIRLIGGFINYLSKQLGTSKNQLGNRATK